MSYNVNDPILKLMCDFIIDHFRCHSIVLFGSRSCGTYSLRSDYDLIGFRDKGGSIKFAREFDGFYLDGFIASSEEAMINPTQFLRLYGGKIIIDHHQFANNLQYQIEKLFHSGPKELSEDEKIFIKIWIEKSLIRIESDCLTSNFRRYELTISLLEYYFSLRKLWYLGPKKSFNWLEKNDPVAIALFKECLNGTNNPKSVSTLARHVLSV